ncbi:GTPase ObgE [bacterium]|nr:GTPase ObgE [bacterium]
MFIDRVTIFAKAGNGGNGCIAFARQKHRRGGPDGGDGGRGGSIYLEVDKRLKTLIDLRYHPHYRARDGAHGKGKGKSGKKGQDLIIKIPPGTVVRNRRTKELIADFIESGQRILVVKGGKRGRGNASLASSRDPAPRFAEEGQPGEERKLDLELKLIADVGLVGYPNSGKSTLLASLTRARPKIASYPFTTLSPNLGVVSSEDKEFVLADIPGLIEGAHKGKGLGHDFLRHIERTKILIHIVDLEGYEGKEPLSNFQAINEELKAHDPLLSERPQIVAANKMDLREVRKNFPQFQKELKSRGYKVYPISALTAEGTEELKEAVIQELERVGK